MGELYFFHTLAKKIWKKQSSIPKTNNKILKTFLFTLNFYFFSPLQKENKSLVGELYLFHILAKKIWKKQSPIPKTNNKILKTFIFALNFYFFSSLQKENTSLGGEPYFFHILAKKKGVKIKKRSKYRKYSSQLVIELCFFHIFLAKIWKK